MKRSFLRKIFGFLAIMIFSVYMAHGLGETLAAQESGVQKYTLDNGMVVLLKNVPGSPSVAIHLLVKTGSATEGKYLGSGLSHFVEHMLFKGTEKRGVGQIAQEVKAFGGNINASTGFDKTFFTLELPNEHFTKALDVIADMMMNPKFDPTELEKERDVIFNEMRLYEDNPERRQSDLLFQTVYTRHPYRHPVIGYRPLLASITREHMLDYYHHHYVPNNMVLSIAGRIDCDKVFSQVKEAFADFKPEPYLTRDILGEPAQLTSRRQEIEFPTELTRLSLAYPSVSMMDTDVFALDVLAMILGQGNSSRLYQRIFREKNLVSSISAENFTPIDRGVFEIACTIKHENLEQTIQAVQEVLDEIKQKGVTKQELDKAKRQVLSRNILNRQTASDMAYDAMIGEAFLGDYNFSNAYGQRIQSVSESDIKKVAQEFLDSNKLNVVILKPVEPNHKDTVAPTQEADRIEKIVLGDGLRVLLREDHTFPVVAMGAAFEGGVRQEPAGQNGISHLMSQLLTKGTRSYSAEKIAELIESHGASLDGFSGLMSFGLRLHLLSQDLDLGLTLLEECLKNPSFQQAELDKLKSQINSELSRRDDSIFYKTYLEFLKTLYQKHPFRFDPLGTRTSLEAIRPQDIQSFYQRLMSPSNMVLYVFGDIDKKTLIKDLEKRFGLLKQSHIEIRREGEPNPSAPRETKITMDKQQAMVMIGFQAPSLQDPDYYGMSIVQTILGAPMNGRLFVKVREELGQSYRLGANYGVGLDTGFVYFHVATSSEQVERVKSIMIDEIKSLQNEGTTDQELNDTKTYLKGAYLMGLETNASLGDFSSLRELYGLGFDYHEHFPELIDRVNKDDIKRIAQKYLDLQTQVCVITLPEKEN